MSLSQVELTGPGIEAESVFSKIALWTARQTGRASAFAIAMAVVIVWAVTGPLFRYSDTWQLVINTGTTIVTFLMVFLLQHAQNRDSAAIQLKLDELIRTNQGARTALLSLEDFSEADLEQLKRTFASIAVQGRRAAAELDEVHGDLQQAKEEIEEAQSAIAQTADSKPPRR